MGRAFAVACCVAAVAPVGAGAALPRSAVDRLDDVRGPQIHVVYAGPADGEDRRLDETGVLDGSVASFQSWLAAETGGANLRLDTPSPPGYLEYGMLHEIVHGLGSVPTCAPNQYRGGHVSDFSNDLDARLEVDSPVVSGSARCTGRLGTRALRATSVSFAASAARCRWRVPALSAGKRFRGRVQATVVSATVTRSFTRLVR